MRLEYQIGGGKQPTRERIKKPIARGKYRMLCRQTRRLVYFLLVCLALAPSQLDFLALLNMMQSVYSRSMLPSEPNECLRQRRLLMVESNKRTQHNGKET